VRKRAIVAIALACAGVIGAGTPAAGEPNENASCVAEFGAGVRESQGDDQNFGEFVRATATQGGIHAGESARRHCGENPKR
jgi:hypothetical protein